MAAKKRLMLLTQTSKKILGSVGKNRVGWETGTTTFFLGLMHGLEIQRLQVKFLGVAFFTTGPGWLLKWIYLSDTQVYYTLL